MSQESKPNAPNLNSAVWAASRGERWRLHAVPMEATMAPVDAPLIQALRLDAPYRIADLGCGGGATSVNVFHQAPQGSLVHGFDIADTLVEMARQRLKPGEPLRFEAADLESAAPPDGPYDRLVSRFGTMFFPHPPQAFANLQRWLKPGGRFAFAVWGPPAENPWFTTVRQVMAQVIDLPAPEPDAPGPFRYGDATKLLALLGPAGFSELNVEDWKGLMPLGGGLPAAEAATFALSAFSNFQELLQAAGDDKFAQAQKLLTERYLTLDDANSVRVAACVHVVTGSRTN